MSDPPRIALLVSRFNSMVTEELLAGARARLLAEGVPEDRITVYRVPGSWELPQAARRIAASGQAASGRGTSGRHDALIAIGCVIRGETAHFDLVVGHANDGLGEVALSSPIPVVFGVLATDTPEQAFERADTGGANKGAEFAEAALEMVALFERIGTS